MTTTQKKKAATLNDAQALENAGDLLGAEAGYRTVLKREPDNPDALALLGALLQKTERAEEAVPLIERAIAAAAKSGRGKSVV